MESLERFLKEDPSIFSKILALALLLLGICLMVGALKDWNWLYAPDKDYQNNWGMGQISRYLGRKTARYIGFLGGVFLFLIGICFTYTAFFK